MADSPEQRPDDTTADSDLGNLPSDLSALDERLTADGERWRRRAPDGQGLPAWARANLAVALVESQSPASGASDGAHDARRSDVGGPHPSINIPENQARTRWRGIAGGLAAVVLVGLFAALLIHNGVSRGGKASATATPAPPPTPTACPSPAPEAPLLPNGCPAATPILGASLQAGTIPLVAPSDPQIVYKIANNVPQRSTDGGKTYGAISVPKSDITALDNIWIAVSPLNASHVFLTLSGSRNGQMCVVVQSSGQAYHGGTLASGGTDCSDQFYSANGGQTWARLRLPGGNVLGGTNFFRVVQGAFQAPAYVFQAQGSRLYAGAGFSTQDGAILASLGARLMTSGDGGATWTLADQPIASAGLYVCDFAVAPTGSTVYAAVTNQSCGNEGLPAMTLWRSDNAGQAWKKVSTLPSPAEGGLVVAPSGALYIFEPAASPISHSMIVSQTAQYALVSVNGGATFSHAPSAGIPGDPTKASLVGPVAMLSDGSALYAVQTGAGSGLYAWKLGDTSWAQVAGAPANGLGAVVAVPAGSGGDTLYITDTSGDLKVVSVGR
ncbi:MAG TPA: sialidase family protein [Ktedonobacterales bacterium]